VKTQKETATLRLTTLDEEVVVWRHEQLVGAGLPHDLAAELAGDSRFDLHALIELVERGCPPELARRILAPIEDPHPETGVQSSQSAIGTETRR
jgi:hypothetical protein